MQKISFGLMIFVCQQDVLFLVVNQIVILQVHKHAYLSFNHPTINGQDLKKK